MNRLIISTALILIALAACKDDDGRTYSNFGYSKDYTTNFCFAFGTESIARVECTPEVLALVGDKESTYSYLVDPQTELCFAYGTKSLAGVPCTDEVKDRIME